MESSLVCNHTSDLQDQMTASQESDLFKINIITDRIGGHKVLLLINQTMTKFEKETRHWLNFFIKLTKKNQLTGGNERKQLVHMTCSVHLHRHDVLTVSLTILLHRSITRVTCTLSC